jgi:hypothetical protein
MPQVDIDGANSKVSADTIRGQSGTTVTIQSGHNLVGSGSGLTALPAANLTGAVPSASLGNIQGKGADIASAGTMVIGTDGGYFDITGTTGITAMTVAVGRTFTLQFDGAVVLTNSSTLKLSGAANFTTAAGDHLTFISVAANDVRQTGFGLTDGGSPVTASSTGITIGSFSKNIGDASGTLAITGVGFQPTVVMFFATVSGGTGFSVGSSDLTTESGFYSNQAATDNTWGNITAETIMMERGSGMQYKGDVNSMDSDGFTIGWTKVGSISGTMQVTWHAMR